MFSEEEEQQEDEIEDYHHLHQMFESDNFMLSVKQAADKAGDGRSCFLMAKFLISKGIFDESDKYMKMSADLDYRQGIIGMTDVANRTKDYKLFKKYSKEINDKFGLLSCWRHNSWDDAFSVQNVLHEREENHTTFVYFFGDTPENRRHKREKWLKIYENSKTCFRIC